MKLSFPKLDYSKLAYSAMMALAAVVVGVLFVLAVVGLLFAACAYPITALIIFLGVVFGGLWADAYDHIN